MATPIEFLGEPAARRNLQVWEWVKQSKVMAIGWTAMRVWLGIMWIQAGVAKLWGAENPGFLHNHGAAVAGFAGHGTPAYTWWGSFLHSFVVPNAGWIAILVAVGELAIGIALCLGLFTRIAAHRQPGAAVHLRDVRHSQRVRFLRTVRHRHPDHVADLELDRRRRPDRRLPPASPPRAWPAHPHPRTPQPGRGRNPHQHQARVTVRLPGKTPPMRPARRRPHRRIAQSSPLANGHLDDLAMSVAWHSVSQMPQARRGPNTADGSPPIPLPRFVSGPNQRMSTPFRRLSRSRCI